MLARNSHPEVASPGVFFLPDELWISDAAHAMRLARVSPMLR